jgi:hypothetical protein
MFASSLTPPKVGVRAVATLVSAAVVSLLLTASSIADAQPIGMPQPALLPTASPLCDSSLVPCLDIDDFAAHAYAHLMVLPKTEARGVGAVMPYGVALGLFGRFLGGVSTSWSSAWSRGATAPLKSRLR